MFGKSALCALLVIVTSYTAVFAQRSNDADRQVCTGTVIFDEKEKMHQLDETAGPGLWCGTAYFYGDLAQRLLAVCPLGARCHVEGSVRGHGDWSWVHVRKIVKMENVREQAIGDSPEVHDLLKIPGSSLLRECSVRLESRQYPCTAVWFILYKDGEHTVQFNRGSEDNPVFAFVGRAMNADTISITGIRIRMGNSSVSFEENEAVGQCILGQKIATCQARMNNGQLLLGEITIRQ